MFGVSHRLRLAKVKLLGHPQIFLIEKKKYSNWMAIKAILESITLDETQKLPDPHQNGSF